MWVCPVFYLYRNLAFEWFVLMRRVFCWKETKKKKYLMMTVGIERFDYYRLDSLSNEISFWIFDYGGRRNVKSILTQLSRQAAKYLLFTNRISQNNFSDVAHYSSRAHKKTIYTGCNRKSCKKNYDNLNEMQPQFTKTSTPHCTKILIGYNLWYF